MGECKEAERGAEEVLMSEQVSEVWVPAYVQGAATAMLLDTGTSHTILTVEAYRQIPESRRPELTEPGLILRQANGSRVKVWGRARLELRIGSQFCGVSVIVGEVTGCMLGMDFLRATGANFDFGRLELQWGGNVVQCAACREAVFFSPARVVATENVNVPAGHTMVVSAKVAGMNGERCLGVLEPFTRGLLPNRGLFVTRSVVRASDSTVSVMVSNVGDRPKRVRRGTALAKMMPIAEVGECRTRMVVPERATGEVEVEQVPQHLRELEEQSTDGLGTEDQVRVRRLLVEYQDVFSSGEFDIGRTTRVKHSIDTGGAAPIRQPLRRSSPQQREEVERQVQELLAKGLIEPSDSPWASPVVLVTKKDGSKRLCLDYRKLNEVTKKDAYPLPRIDDSLDALGNAKYFCTLDLASGYWQVEMNDEARDKSAFSTTSGLYAWNVLPFGLCNAPSTFERLMESVLAGLRWETLLVYLDDVIVFGNTIAESVSRLEAVLVRLRDAGLKLKPSKCNLFRKEVCYLGHIVSSEGIHTDPSKIEAVRDWPTPKTPTQVRSFLGLASYYRRFIRAFAEVAAPLHRLTEKKKEFVWTDECDSAFEKLKEALITAPVLAYPKEQGQFVLDTDASAFAIGGVLSQVHDGEERVIAYGSKALSKPERNYCVTRRELLAIVVFLRKYRHYIGGSKVKVRTDHGSLRWLCNFKDPEGQLARWLEVLASFDYELEYRQGRKHQNADGLSRVPCRQCIRIKTRGEGRDEVDEGIECSMRDVGCQTEGVDGDSGGAGALALGCVRSVDEVEDTSEVMTGYVEYEEEGEVENMAHDPLLEEDIVEKLGDGDMGVVRRGRKYEGSSWFGEA